MSKYQPIKLNKKVILDPVALSEEVNKVDKKQGIRLRHPNLLKEPYMTFRMELNDFNMYIAALILLLNGIDPNRFFICNDEEMGVIGGDISVTDEEFSELSFLEWEDEETTYDTSTLMFRLRFLTILLMNFFDLKDISVNQFKMNDKNSGVGKDEASYMYLINTEEDIKHLVMSMIEGDYKNIISKVHHRTSYGEPDIPQLKKYNKNVKEAYLDLYHGLKVEFFTGSPTRFMDDDMGIYSSLCLAYMLATNNRDVRFLPSIHDIKDCSVYNDLFPMLRILGHGILKQTKNKKEPMMYKAFKQAHPTIRSNYFGYDDIAYDYEIIEAMYALSFADFFCNDSNVHKHITHMMNL